MPKIRFIQVSCGHCGASYKVRLEKVAERAPFECLACGASVETAPYLVCRPGRRGGARIDLPVW